jgi:radical SAM superfamily enzyme YgiQ (UPF0313 family)
MNILLIEPAKPRVSLGGDDVFLYEPLALEYLGAGIPREHDVKILDMRLDKSLTKTLDEYQPDIVGITGYTIHVNVVRDLFEQIKASNGNILTVVGGHHATVVPEDFESPFIDLIVRGEGVVPFQEIVQRHHLKQNFSGIPGVIIPGEGIEDPQLVPQVIDLDSLPFPRRSLTESYRKQYFSDWMKPLASIRTSKGCPYRCTFCALWKLTGGKYLTREPEKILEELSQIEEKFIFFADDESMLDADRMSRLAELIGKSAIQKKYFCYARSDTIARNPDLFRKWKNIGLDRVFVGLEFSSDEDLSYIHKRSSIEDNDLAVQILHDLNIEVYASFILRPDFTKDDFASLREYCLSLDLMFPSFAVLTPLPGTDLYQEVREQMIIDNYDYFDFIHTLLPTKLPLKDFYQEYYDLYIWGKSPKNHLKYFRKFPLSEIPGLYIRGLHFYQRLKLTFLDYPGDLQMPSA